MSINQKIVLVNVELRHEQRVVEDLSFRRKVSHQQTDCQNKRRYRPVNAREKEQFLLEKKILLNVFFHFYFVGKVLGEWSAKRSRLRNLLTLETRWWLHLCEVCTGFTMLHGFRIHALGTLVRKLWQGGLFCVVLLIGALGSTAITSLLCILICEHELILLSKYHLLVCLVPFHLFEHLCLILLFRSFSPIHGYPRGCVLVSQGLKNFFLFAIVNTHLINFFVRDVQG